MEAVQSESEQSEEEEEEEKSGKPQRRMSATLLGLLYRHFPDLRCRSDTDCLYLVTLHALGEWDALGLEAFREKLQQLRRLVVAMQPRTSTQRGQFVRAKAQSFFRRVHHKKKCPNP